jgi:uncharacterized membrane protein HdeD (DUF308 family)
MKNLLGRAWQMLLLRGIFALLFGLMALAWPGLTLISLVYLFAFYAIADGVATLSGAWQHRKSEANWGLVFFIGIISLLAGLITLFFPGITAIYLIIFIGVRALIVGILTIIAAIRLRKEIENEGWLILNGVISVIFGLWVIIRPGEGALALISVIGIFALIIGIVTILLAIRARKWTQVVKSA